MHWLIIFVNHFEEVEVFDPLGVRISWITNEIPIYGKTYLYNETPVQALTSKLCGQFCVFFSLSRLMNQDLTYSEWANAVFDPKDFEKNEQIVLDFIQNE